MPLSVSGVRPIWARRSRICLALNPASISSRVLPHSTYAQLPLEPLPKIVNCTDTAASVSTAIWQRQAQTRCRCRNLLGRRRIEKDAAEHRIVGLHSGEANDHASPDIILQVDSRTEVAQC